MREFIEGGVYEYDGTLVLYENGHFMMFGWDGQLEAFPGGGGNCAIDSDKICKLIYQEKE